jgi:hypothetical protein
MLRAVTNAVTNTPDRNRLFVVTEVQKALSRLVDCIPFQDHPKVIAVKNSPALNWIQGLAKHVFEVAKRLYLGYGLDPLTHQDIKASFVSLLRRVKEDAIKNHNTNITFAILSVPDFFNKTVKDIIVEACGEAGIDTISPFARTVMGLWGARIEIDDTRTIVLDYGRYHLAMRLYQRPEDPRMPISQGTFSFDMYGTEIINRELLKRVLDTDATLKNQINSGADPFRLLRAIETARVLIKGSIEQLMARVLKDAKTKITVIQNGL